MLYADIVRRLAFGAAGAKCFGANGVGGAVVVVVVLVMAMPGVVMVVAAVAAVVVATPRSYALTLAHSLTHALRTDSLTHSLNH